MLTNFINMGFMYFFGEAIINILRMTSFDST